MNFFRQMALMACLAVALQPAIATAQAVPNFSRDVLPILSENCFACHGPDVADRESEYRLDLRDELLTAVSIDNPEQSELLQRVRSEDPDSVMPPPSSHKKPLSKAQQDVLSRWIAAGAMWGKHWAYELPVKASLPEGDSQHPIDALIQRQLAKKGLQFSPPAASHTLQRRLSFDLVGLPPAADAVPLDGSQASVERYIDELLSSPHFGERMAMWWLDVARYADTDGFQADATRTNWPWRDWVVNAFNQNMPWDQFTIEQFAGDLLPDATPEQKLATCFHRNHMTNGEGGRDPEESRVDYVIDRVNTVGSAWLGLTLGCCQCHSHKFDPISQGDYYSLAAFFNSIDEDGKAGGGAKPYLSYQSPNASPAIEEANRLVEQRRPAEEAARKNAEAPFRDWLRARIDQLKDGFVEWHPLQAVELDSSEGTVLAQEPDHSIHASGLHPNQDDYRVVASPKLSRVTGIQLEVLPSREHTGGALSRGKSGEFILTDIKVQVRRRGSSQVRDLAVASAIADFSADKKQNDNYGDVKDTLDDDPRNGWTTKGSSHTEPHKAVFALQQPLRLDDDEELIVELRQRSTLGDSNIARFRLSVSEQLGEAIRSLEPSPLATLAASGQSDPEKLDAKLRTRLFEQFLEEHGPYRLSKESLDRAERQLREVKKSADKLNVMVLEERQEPRETFVLVRGVWDQHGEQVQPDVPAAIAAWPKGEPRNRLGLAKWIVSRENPLAARVLVNHLWQMFFGQGLVRTQDDFGLQGEAPTHPELLDWLAVELMDQKWDVKHLIRLIVTSQAYQQSSAVSPELLALDPENKWLARGARFRLPSWMLRDSALAASGLLNRALGGPPVRPYQPDGVWEELFMGRFNYEPSEGTAQYRRTLYAFWRRAIAPTFLFDAAQRRTCEVRVGRTNTPLHALTLLNDTTYLEAARTLAMQADDVGDAQVKELEYLFRQILSRPPTAQELAVAKREADRAAEHYRRDPESASQLMAVGQPMGDLPGEKSELAALMIVASMLLNLDEAITHE